MGAMYSISGSLLVRRCEDSQRILDELRKFRDNEIDVFRVSPGQHQTIHISICGGFSYGGMAEIDSLLRELGAHAQKPDSFQFDIDGEKGEMVVGPSFPEVDRVVRRQHFFHALYHLQHLNDEEHQEMLDILMKKKKAPRIPSGMLFSSISR